VTLQATTSTAQPERTPEYLREQIQTMNVSLNDALARKAGVLARIDAAGGPSERVRLRNGELGGVEGQIRRIKADIAGLEAELVAREAAAANPPPALPIAPAPVPTPVAVDVAPAAPWPGTTTVPPATGMDLNAVALGAGATALLLLPLLFLVAWRAGQRAAVAARAPDLGELGARLAKLEEGMAAMGSDVERVEESQRFLTSALVADGRQSPVREEVRTRS
jgi:hypothetical protein